MLRASTLERAAMLEAAKVAHEFQIERDDLLARKIIYHLSVYFRKLFKK